MEIARVVATARKKGFAGFLFGKQVSYEFSCIHVSLRASLVGKRFVVFILENSVKPQITALAIVNAVWRKVWGRHSSSPFRNLVGCGARLKRRVTRSPGTSGSGLSSLMGALTSSPGRTESKRS